jgi:hypothetical protein
MSKTIPLTQGKYAIVDDEDYEAVNKYKWFAQLRSGGWYAARCGDWRERPRKCFHMHRVIMDAPDELFVDHWNHDGLDNRRSNLRVCTWGQNQDNKGKQKGQFTSQFKGVWWSRNERKWRAAICDNAGGRKYLGYFALERDAALAYNEAATRIHGEFAYLNDVPTEGGVA